MIGAVPDAAAAVDADAAVPMDDDAAAAAAAPAPVDSAVDAPAASTMGRPRLEAELDHLMWDRMYVPATTLTVRDLITDAFAYVHSNNMTDHAAKGLFDLLKQYTPHPLRIPTWKAAESLLVKECPVKAQHHIACSYDCEIIKDSIEKMSATKEGKQDLEALKNKSCSICHRPFVDGKGRWNRVRIEYDETGITVLALHSESGS